VKEFGKQIKMKVCSVLLKASKDSKDVHVEIEGQSKDSVKASGEEVKKIKGFFQEAAEKLKNAFKGVAKSLVMKNNCTSTGNDPTDTKRVTMETGNDAQPITTQHRPQNGQGANNQENLVIVDA
jgi:hypothetical protein